MNAKLKENLKASDLMTKNPYVVKSSMTIDETSLFFLEHNFTSAPVIGTDREILGILDEFTLIKIQLSQQIQDNGRDKLAHHVNLLRHVHKVKESEGVIEIMRLMIKAPNHRLFVVSGHSNIVGIISPKDILRYVVGYKNEKSDLKKELDSAKSDLDTTLKELQKTKSRLDIYQDIVMENPIMIHSVDANGKILMANKKMHEILQYSPGELVGKTLYDIYAENVHAKAMEGLQKIINEGSHKNTFTTMLTKTKQSVRVDVASAALYEGKKKFIGTISVSRPVDSDALLRALHGIVTGIESADEKYIALEDFDEVENTLKSKSNK